MSENTNTEDVTFDCLSDDDMMKVLEAITNGVSFADALNFDRKNLEIAYSLAYSQYSAGNYKDAKEIFKLLYLYDYWDARFSAGFAACLQVEENYEKALEVYNAVIMADGMQNPYYLYQGALCALKLGKVEAAMQTLDLALDVGDIEQHTETRKQIADLLESLRKEHPEFA